MITLDTSAIMSILTNEPSKPAILRAAAGHDLLVSRSLVPEIGNGFSSMFKRGRSTRDMARRALDDFDLMAFEYVEIDLRAAVELAAELGVYAYDAYPILCALSSASRLLSLDNGQRHAARRVGVALIDLEPQRP